MVPMVEKEDEFVELYVRDIAEFTTNVPECATFNYTLL